VQFYEPLWAWQQARVAKRAGGYSLDLDSTVFERYARRRRSRSGATTTSAPVWSNASNS